MKEKDMFNRFYVVLSSSAGKKKKKEEEDRTPVITHSWYERKQISIPLTREDLAASFVFFLADLSRCTWIMEVERTPTGHAQYLFLPSSPLVGVAESWQESGNNNDIMWSWFQRTVAVFGHVTSIPAWRRENCSSYIVPPENVVFRRSKRTTSSESLFTFV